jgi:N-ethylmaleimide reductase
MIERVWAPMLVAPEVRFASIIRKIFKGTFMLNGGYDAEKGTDAIRKGEADLISYGSLFLANPDLPERFKRIAPLNTPDIETFYVGEERGYIDYPSL